MVNNFNSSGSKYLRKLQGGIRNRKNEVFVDVYAVLATFGVTCPARQHAIKKILCAGLRKKASQEQDLAEAIDALQRAVQMNSCTGTANSDIENAVAMGFPDRPKKGPIVKLPGTKNE